MLSMPRIIRPDSSGILRLEVGSPVEPATRRLIKRNKELTETSDQEFLASSKSACGIYVFYNKIIDS
jgi:hypothetical protein